MKWGRTMRAPGFALRFHKNSAPKSTTATSHRIPPANVLEVPVGDWRHCQGDTGSFDPALDNPVGWLVGLWWVFNSLVA